MNENQLLSLVATLFGLLTAVLSWAGMRIFNKLDALSDKLTSQYVDFHSKIAEGDNVLHDRVTELDRRVTRVETRCHVSHGSSGGSQ